MMTFGERLDRWATFWRVVCVAWKATVGAGYMERVNDWHAHGVDTSQAWRKLQSEADQHVVSVGWLDVSPTHPRYQFAPAWCHLDIVSEVEDVSTMWAETKHHRSKGGGPVILVAYGHLANLKRVTS